MHFLYDDEGWKLLFAEVFGKEYLCNPRLEEIGREIARNCRGLPLAIVVIGGILSKLDCTYEVWENVAEKIHSITATAANRCSEILSLSYNQLPLRLKACFLYMGIFPEDYEIHVSKLIKLYMGSRQISKSS
ncbi:putative disease resistance protein [Abeliophyllum distichum]|uniref:Disease resistance protein n=1 Tax=Abeliophyllum distichum TaxID=126358 RepID=A0ABD1RVI5_9LAMI